MNGYMGAAGPTFYDSRGNAITQIECGEPYTFDVPGHSLVWLDQYHNGRPGYSGTLPVPMPSYIADCVSEPGIYLNNVYAVDANGNRGNFIGATQLTVQAGQLSQGVVPTDQTASFQAEITARAGAGAGIPFWLWLALAGAALYYMR